MPEGYHVQIQSLDVIAVRKGQHEVNAPQHATWGTVKCDSCPDEFLIGPPRMYGGSEKEDEYVQRLEKILAGEHRSGQRHQNSYELGS